MNLTMGPELRDFRTGLRASERDFATFGRSVGASERGSVSFAPLVAGFGLAPPYSHGSQPGPHGNRCEIYHVRLKHPGRWTLAITNCREAQPGDLEPTARTIFGTAHRAQHPHGPMDNIVNTSEQHAL